jgi:integrase
MVREIQDKKRRRDLVEEKVAILRRHLADKAPVSDLCDEHTVELSVFYGWQRSHDSLPPSRSRASSSTAHPQRRRRRRNGRSAIVPERCRSSSMHTDPSSCDGVLDRAMLQLAFAGGLRVSQLAGMRLNDAVLQPPARPWSCA